MEPPPGATPDLPRYKGRVTVACGGLVSPPGFEPGLAASSTLCLYPLGYKDWSRRAVLNRRPARYECAALPLSYTGLAPGQGFEPQPQVPETCDLPLVEPGSNP